ncbi:MAG: DegT/DnrJ/EryC1/StrS family aminotransferase, partial [Candidatus Omnitrophica bacterium]|nr:DegT/DnrJ/EryC1/StrS family aminotransferase [Candidatus Omnitrophota bacterium]
EPVFADIDPESLCLSPKSVDQLIPPDVVAVCPVHVYGNVCDLDYFESLRSKGIRVLYDSAHAFGVRIGKRSLGSFGDAETFSLHATKILNACEGGLIVTRDKDFAHRIALMTNFGFTGENDVELIGTNAKLSEIHAVLGLQSLKYLPNAIAIRRELCEHYRKLLSDVCRVRLLKEQAGVKGNAQYFPIFLEDEAIRDAVYERLKAKNIFSRKYFHPLVSHFGPYECHYWADTPVAETTARSVLCLPLHTLMNVSDVESIVEALKTILIGCPTTKLQ